ncbi:MAG: cobalamin biosynthesis protein CobW, partial [Treponema sp.]|nr:cobalamin biosynthesis protein CobW [Treponema sp.]
CKQLEEGEIDADDDDDDDDEHHHEHNPEHGEEGHHCDEHCEHHHDHDDDDHDGHHHHHHHEHKHEGDSGADDDEYGIGTFIYYRRKPFDRNKLDDFAGKWPKNIIRCKGLCYFSDEEDMAYVFETSGRQIQAGPSGQWIATASPKEQKEILAQNPDIAKDWDEKVGDRMIKLCIIGQKLDKKAISAALDACLA